MEYRLVLVDPITKGKMRKTVTADVLELIDFWLSMYRKEADDTRTLLFAIQLTFVLMIELVI